MPERLPLFATASRGTEPLLAGELSELGAQRVRQERGGVRFAANFREALRILLWSRIAMRLLYPLASAEVKGARALYEAARAIAWERHLTPESTFSVEATLRDSEHSHSGFVALKVKDAIADRMREERGRRPNVDPREPQVSVVVHLGQAQLSIALDLAGRPLNQRGYRLRPTTAPLKETLAAAMLRAAAYTGNEALVDPLCGSGTLPIEAALIAANRAPHLRRSFAVERWPERGPEARQILADLRKEAAAGERRPGFPILGFDKDAEAIEAARQNARGARLSDVIHFHVSDALGVLPLSSVPAGLLVGNPPYGGRLSSGGQKGMKAFYFKLGESLRRLEGWRAFILSGNPAFESAFHLRPSSRRTIWNGPIECRLLGYSL